MATLFESFRDKVALRLKRDECTAKAAFVHNCDYTYIVFKKNTGSNSQRRSGGGGRPERRNFSSYSPSAGMREGASGRRSAPRSGGFSRGGSSTGRQPTHRTGYAGKPSTSSGEYGRGGGSSYGTRSGSRAHTSGGSRSFSRGATFSRPSFSSGGSRSGSRGGFSRGGARSGGGRPSGGRGGRFDQKIDISRFVNKAVITEETEHFTPEHAFSDFEVDARLKANIVKKGYVTPTPIQDRAIPHVLRGEDVVGIANTGTGKTAAFLIPLIDKMLKNNTERALIVVPTRELAVQIEEELRGFTPHLNIHGVTCVGGANIGKQMMGLRRAHNFVIGTPGRIKDLMERKVLDLSKFKSVVLDEADRMLDMGFIDDMRFMMDRMPKDRHTLFFSATMSRDIEKLIGDFLHNPVSISVKTGDTSKTVDQDIVRIEKGKDKLDILCDLLKQPDYGKVLIFGRTKHGVERLMKDLGKRGFKAESIHGNKSQGQRQRALDSFKAGRMQILVATDVAARGIDVSNISHVINYDVPATYEDYVHRIGRTGRAGKKGKALTFVE